MFRLVVLLLILSSQISASPNATFYMTDGSKREAEFISLSNGIVTVKIISPNGKEISSQLPKVRFQKIELYDWRLVDLTADNWPPQTTSPGKPDAVKEVAPAATTAGPAVVVIMKDGSILEGKKNGEDAETITFIAGGKSVKLFRNVIDTVMPVDILPGTSRIPVVVIQKDGTLVEGEKFSEDANSIVVVVNGHNVTISRMSIDTILAADRLPEGWKDVSSQVNGPKDDSGPANSVIANADFVFENIYEDDKSAADEAGSYQRKSVSFLNTILLADETAMVLSPELINEYISKLQNKLCLARFDYNPLPGRLQEEFVNLANAKIRALPKSESALTGKFKIKKGKSEIAGAVGSAIDSVLLPEILKIVEMDKEMRLAGYLTSAQKNSFINDKAKQAGYTTSQLHKLMNSSFLYVPYVSSVSCMEKSGKIIHKMKMGLIWYRIVTSGGAAKAVETVVKETMSIGMASKQSRLPLMVNGSTVSPEVYAFHSSLKNGARNLLVATQEMPEFRLSSQVSSHEGGKVEFLLGKKEGLMVDDKYRIVEFMEKEDGSIKQKNKGWVSVKKVVNNKDEEIPSIAGLRSGKPAIGEVVSEFPRIPIDILFAGEMLPVIKQGDIDSAAIGLGFGPMLCARYNIGRYIRVPQLFFNVGYSLCFSGVNSSYKNSLSTDPSAVSRGNLDLSLVKKFWARNVYFTLEAGYRVTSAVIPFEKIDDSNQNTTSDEISGGTLLLAGYGGIGMGPKLTMELGVRFNAGSGTGETVTRDSEGKKISSYKDEYPYSWNGIGISIQFVWSPPSLPFDPIDMVRAMTGL